MKLLIILGILVSSFVSSNINDVLKVINIQTIGAIPNVRSYKVSQHNSNIIIKSFEIANISNIKNIYVPNNTFYISSIYISNITNVNFIIDGKLIANNNIKKWPIDELGNKMHIFKFFNVNNFIIKGSGTIDGQGFRWWWMAILSSTNKTIDNRPNMINIEQSYNFELSGITMLNSPKFHVRLIDIINVNIHNFVIYVDTFRQNNLFEHYKIPTFPLNTDGIDLSVVNATVRNFNITNFDDSVAIKPCNNEYKYCKCSSNILVYNGYVKFGVGMTVGSVQPNQNDNCVNNVIFKNVFMENPLKGIYIKTNRGNKGNGSITNILYKNITMISPIWWSIYIGPQQQKQPDGSGEGCMKYPHDPYCPTEPKITIANITLKNINIQNSLNPYPGLLRCNETNICKRINFYNVSVNTMFDTYQYICENAEVKSIFSNPVLTC